MQKKATTMALAPNETRGTRHTQKGTAKKLVNQPHLVLLIGARCAVLCVSLVKKAMNKGIYKKLRPLDAKKRSRKGKN